MTFARVERERRRAEMFGREYRIEGYRRTAVFEAPRSFRVRGVCGVLVLMG
jgi:hypothetical protein